jgi:hypothetical protein
VPKKRKSVDKFITAQNTQEKDVSAMSKRPIRKVSITSKTWVNDDLAPILIVDDTVFNLMILKNILLINHKIKTE